MKLVFAHDGPVFIDAQKNTFTGGSFNQTILNRYLKIFNQISVAIRYRQLTDLPTGFRQVQHPNISFYEIPTLSNPLLRLKNTKIAIRLLNKIISNNDVLIARMPSETGFLAVQVAQRLNKPWAIEVVGCPFDAYWNHGNLMGKLYAPFAYFKLRAITQKSNFTLYVTSQFLQKRYPSYYSTASCSNVEIQETQDNILMQRINRIHSSNSQETTLGFIGAFTVKYKGFSTIIRALSQLRHDGSNVILKVAGIGNPDELSVILDRYAVRKYIIFEGMLSAGQPILNWLDTIDIYVQPSLTEGLPRSIIEAMSRGCPVVGSKVGGIPELIDNQFLHKPKDYKRLSYLLHQLIIDKQLQESQSRNNFNIAKQYYSIRLNEIRSNFWEKLKHSVINIDNE